MFCPKCGTQLPDGAAFCGNCGMALAQSDSANYVQTVVQDFSSTVPAETPAQTAAQPTIQAQVAPSAYNASDAAVGGHRKAGIIAIAAILALAAIAAAVFYMLFLAPYKLDAKTFPDESLRNAIAFQCDFDGDGKITRNQAKEVVSLNLASSGVSSLEGLSRLANLHELDLTGCKALTNVDLSNLSSLTKLNVKNSALETLDVSKLAGLQELDATGTKIETLDVSSNNNLVALRVDDTVAVSGVDNTQVREQWVMATYGRDGYGGLEDGFPTGIGLSAWAKFTFEYDDQARLASYTSIDWWDEDHKDGSETEYTYTYDSENNEIIVASGGSTSSYKSESIYSFNDSGQIILKTENSYDGGAISNSSEYTYEYDAENRIVAYRSKYFDDEFIYNDAGQLTEVDYIYHSDGSSSRHTSALFEYNDAGQLSRLDMERGRYDFEYDEAGRLASYSKYWKSYNIETYNTEADWTTLTLEDTGTPTVVTYTYNEAGTCTAARSSFDNLNNPDYPSSSVIEGELVFNDIGMLVERTFVTDSIYNGEAHTYEASDSIEYTRIFTPKDADDVAPKLSIIDPIAPMRQHSVVSEHYRLLDEQPELVRELVLASTLYNFQ